MKRPVLFIFMVLCALFWTVMFALPFFKQPQTSQEPAKNGTVSTTNRPPDQTNALGFMIVSWVGVGVLWMTQRTSSTESNKPA